MRSITQEQKRQMSTAKSEKHLKEQQLSPEILSEIGQRLRSIRKTLDLTQRELTKQIDVASASYLSEIESGKTKPGFEFMYRFCGHYQVNPMYLMYGDEPQFLKDAPQSQPEEKIPEYDFGNNSELVHGMLRILEKSKMFEFAFLEFCHRYNRNNSKEIEEDIRLYNERKLKESQ